MTEYGITEFSDKQQSIALEGPWPDLAPEAYN